MTQQPKRFTDLYLVTGRGRVRAIQEPTRTPSPAESHASAYLAVRRRACATVPTISNAAEAHATLAAHPHHPAARCEQRQAALGFLDRGRRR